MRIPKAVKFLERRRNKLLGDLETQQGPRAGYMRAEVAALDQALGALEEKSVRLHQERAQRMRDNESHP